MYGKKFYCAENSLHFIEWRSVKKYVDNMVFHTDRKLLYTKNIYCVHSVWSTYLLFRLTKIPVFLNAVYRREGVGALQNS